MSSDEQSIKQLDEPAFPMTLPDADDEGFKTHYPGMTLRDWFAGQALQALVSRMSNTKWADGTQDVADAHGMTPTEVVASASYEYADAMLRARERDA